MSDSDPFPDSLLRGIRSGKWVTGGYVHADAFGPDSRTAADRNDGCAEASINWEDDEGALKFLLSQPEFRQVGAARVDTEELDHIKRSRAGSEFFNYERSPMGENPYHGNLLFSQASEKQQLRQLMSNLALHAEYLTG